MENNLFKFTVIRPVENKRLNQCYNYIRDLRTKDLFANSFSTNTLNSHEELSTASWLDEVIQDIRTSVYLNFSEATKNRSLKELNNELAQNSMDKILQSNDLLKDLVFLQETQDKIERHIFKFNKSDLCFQLNIIVRKYKKGKCVEDFIANEFESLFNTLYNKLYATYIAKRLSSENLQPLLQSIRTLHTLFWIGYDQDLVSYNRTEVSRCLRPIINYLVRIRNRFSKRPLPELVGDKKQEVENDVSSMEYNCLDQANCETVINSSDELKTIFNAKVVIHPIFSRLFFYNHPFNNLQHIGIGDLKIVKESLIGYEPHEISHIENILKGEDKNRIHRVLNTVDTLSTTTTETTNEKTTEFSTNERNEIDREIQNTIDDSVKLSNNLSVNYTGPVIVNNTTDFAYDRSTSDSVSQANNFAKEIVNKTVEKVKKKRSNTESIRRLIESEDTNSHGFNNVKGREHITGIYRYVNKKYRSQIYNYGKRVMYEFIIPEPAAFYLFSIKSKDRFPEQAPVKPDDLLLKADEINQSKIDELSTIYDLSDIESEPVEIESLIDWNIDYGDHDTDLPQPTYTRALPELPSDHQIISIEFLGPNSYIERNHKKNGNFVPNIPGTVNPANADQHEWKDGPVTRDKIRKNFNAIYENLEHINKGSILSFNHRHVVRVHFNLKVISIKNLTEWRNNAYRIIMAKHIAEINKYKSELAIYEERKRQYLLNLKKARTLEMSDRTAKKIMEDELRKFCLSQISFEFDSNREDDILNHGGQAVSDEQRFNNGMESRKIFHLNNDCLTDQETEDYCIPALNLNKVRQNGPLIQFLEQALEWGNISYLFYSYYWKKETEWLSIKDYYSGNNEKFLEFLRAGAARVIVPVYLGYEEAVMHYLQTREVWNGGEAPAIDDELYIPIFEEIKNRQDDIQKAESSGDPWEYTLPTSLVYLQKSSNLPNME